MTTVNVELAYNPGHADTKPVALGPEDVMVAHFKTPPTLKENGQGGQVTTFENNAGSWDRVLCVSTTPGDFTENAVTYTKPNGKTKTVCTNTSKGPQPTVFFGANPGEDQFQLLPNTDYYANMKTVAASSNDCDVKVTLTAGK